MSVGFARPNIADLVFYLYSRPVHPELFQVYAETRIEHETYCAVLRICDAGHAVELRLGDLTLTEVTATQDQLLPAQRRLLQNRLHGYRDEAVTVDGVSYQVSFQLEQLNADAFLSFNEELLHDCHRAEISHCFPAAGRLAPGPLSLIRADAQPGSLLIHAYHTFPDNCAVIKTQSLFEF